METRRGGMTAKHNLIGETLHSSRRKKKKRRKKRKKEKEKKKTRKKEKKKKRKKEKKKKRKKEKKKKKRVKLIILCIFIPHDQKQSLCGHGVKEEGTFPLSLLERLSHPLKAWVFILLNFPIH